MRDRSIEGTSCWRGAIARGARADRGRLARMTGTTGASTPIPESIGSDRPCLACGYNLRGLAPGGVCPECGVPIARSLRGNLLRYSSAAYLAMLHHGTFLVQASIIIQVLMTIASLVGVGIITALASGGPPPARALTGFHLAVN